MPHCQTLYADQYLAAFQKACQAHVPVTVSFSSEGKWHIWKLSFDELTGEQLVLSDVQEWIAEYQPVGICISAGHTKYIFDSQVAGFYEGTEGKRICIDLPQSVELMWKRAYLRQPVPESMNVKVLFWHRGYINHSEEKPAEEYWQGRLLDLSAGGAQFEIELEQRECFQTGQLLGVQFTPMSYQKPFLLESHVRYIKLHARSGFFNIGVQFLGLESPEGRQVLHRLLEVIGEYERMSQPQSGTAAS
ncbi:MAG: PilZ domain-containing protein [Planctomycetaceae bacterium]|nr:PilZ domain-containing protein [Planctomycetaceae bacterium]